MWRVWHAMVLTVTSEHDKEVRDLTHKHCDAGTGPIPTHVGKIEKDVGRCLFWCKDKKSNQDWNEGKEVKRGKDAFTPGEVAG